jgi:outer membrane protein OmpA-like peptidoglycan-associated protein
MKRAAQRWMVAQIAGLCLAATATVASGADVAVTDADRTFKNFTRESATVSQDEVRLEVRGLMEQDEENTKLDLLGFPVNRLPGTTGGVNGINGGIIDLVASYGFAKNAEVGFILPGYIQSLSLNSGAKDVNNSDVGDLMLYGKFQRAVAEHWNVGAGLELTTPNGPVNKGFGTGSVGLNPIISTRYQQGRVGVGTNVGFNFYTGDFPDVFNYGAEVILRASKSFAIRTEIAGRLFNQGGRFGGRYHDLTILPGIDFKWSDTLTIRPTGLANGTDTALDWGIGLGIATTFTAPSLSMPEPPPPPPPAVAKAPPPPPPPAKEKIVLRGVHFDFNKATIRAEDMPILDQAAETLKEHGAITVTVEGHTDSIGSEEYNQKLSVRRASAVRDYLAQHGIDATRMTVVGKGESDPVASNDTEDGRAQNRRVELLVAS